MTFDPVAPAPALAVIAAVLLVLRLVTLRPAVTTGAESVSRWAAMTTAMLLMLLAAFRPGLGDVAEETSPAAASRGGANVFFVVDRSAESALPDWDGAPRLTGMRQDMVELMQSNPDARFAVISFASRPAIDWPLSGDTWSLEPVVAAMNPYPADPDEQVNPGAAANVLRYQLIAARQQYPAADNLVYYFGSGAAAPDTPQGQFQSGGVDGGAVFGYGPRTGQAELGDIAGQLGLPYLQRSPGTDVPQAQTHSAATAVAADSGTPQRREFYWLLTMVAAVLLLGEIYLSVRDLRRARATQRQVLS
ncbi:VWA domain-containing protein [Mycobacterium sp. SMC-4]|uniref:VWA domain-containing protein n=1 Tax=Mycobacterium sp. SMC-4 TaxID=2857059 RepID=UPI0021B33A36|nr:VWA domain-containing protein [Mycobacterium sp. SMC-4]UXA18685.1 VWA domain-containing protein [Mycobacterium sp. SMC-4]